METLLKDPAKVKEISPLPLAFLGDGIYDLLVREYLLIKANRPVGALNQRKVEFVCCKSQAEAFRRIMPDLSEEEIAVYKRGRNAQINTIPKNASAADYHSATGFESLLGYLYLTGNMERIRNLFQKIVKLHEAKPLITQP